MVKVVRRTSVRLHEVLVRVGAEASISGGVSAAAVASCSAATVIVGSSDRVLPAFCQGSCLLSLSPSREPHRSDSTHISLIIVRL